MDIEKLIDLVTHNIKQDWPTIYKIRYIYLELGKYLSKDTDFFFSIQNKLDEFNLNYNQVNYIYNSLYGRKKEENLKGLFTSKMLDEIENMNEDEKQETYRLMDMIYQMM